MALVALDAKLTGASFGLTNYDNLKANIDYLIAQGVGGSATLDEAEITADVSGIIATTESTATAVITGNSVAYDGSKVKVEFWCPGFVNAGAANNIYVVLMCDSTVIGHAPLLSNNTAGNEPGVVLALHTPSSGSHTYAVKAFVDSASFAGTIKAGAGGSGALLPAFLRVTKA